MTIKLEEELSQHNHIAAAIVISRFSVEIIRQGHYEIR